MSNIQYNCTDIDLLLCDYVDQALTSDQKIAFEEHLTTCSSCQELVNDSLEVIQLTQRSADIEPPPELLSRIMQQLPVVEKQQKRHRGLSGKIAKLFEPILQPRFAMGMAMTILSFSMLGKFIGPTQTIKPSDLDPIRIVSTIDDKIHRTWNNAVKYYQNLRVVYEFQSRLREWNQMEEQSSSNEQPSEQTDREKK